MLTAVTYNCDPESLGEMDAAEYVDAFENEVYAKPLYREVSVKVTFNPGRNGVTDYAVDGELLGLAAERELFDEFKRLAERAFDYVCRHG